MIINDKYYTPEHIAKLMIALSKIKSPSKIADFASGDGALLYYAMQKWPNAKLYANDISAEVLEDVKNKIPSCYFENIDFLSNELRNTSSLLSSLINKLDLILLNPPYSFRGQFKFTFKDNKSISCPRSLAFVLIATDYLAPKGELVALLPAGAVYGIRGRETINFFGKGLSMKIIKEFPSNAFSLCSANTVLVSIKKTKRKRTFYPNSRVNTCYEIIRGNIQMHCVVQNTRSRNILIHSTSLQETHILPIKINKIELARKIIGFNVLIQRVGNIKKHKITHYYSKKGIMISDCIIAIPTSSFEESQYLVDYIHNKWENFIALYTGTCAKHLTITDLSHFLAEVPKYGSC